MSARMVLFFLAVSCVLAPLSHARNKKKQVLPDYVLRAQAVLVVIHPDTGEPVTDPMANRTAQGIPTWTLRRTISMCSQPFVTFTKMASRPSRQSAEAWVEPRPATPRSPRDPVRSIVLCFWALRLMVLRRNSNQPASILSRETTPTMTDHAFQAFARNSKNPRNRRS